MSLHDSFAAGEGCPVIDVHGHLGPFPGIFMPEAPLEAMLCGLERCGIESLVISPHSALLGDTREGNAEMLDAVRQNPGRILGYCTLNPTYPDDLPLEAERYLDQPGVVGIKIHPSLHGTPVDAPAYVPVWELAERRQLIVLSHTWGATGGCGADDMRKVAERYPNVRLFLGHSCYGAWDKAIALATEFPNVYLELTAAYHVFGLLELMCKRAGSTKVLFGSDYPWFDPLVAIGCVTSAHIDEEQMTDILHRNARRLLDEQHARLAVSAQAN